MATLRSRDGCEALFSECLCVWLWLVNFPRHDVHGKNQKMISSPQLHKQIIEHMDLKFHAQINGSNQNKLSYRFRGDVLYYTPYYKTYPRNINMFWRLKLFCMRCGVQESITTHYTWITSTQIAHTTNLASSKSRNTKCVEHILRTNDMCWKTRRLRASTQRSVSEHSCIYKSSLVSMNVLCTPNHYATTKHGSVSGLNHT